MTPALHRVLEAARAVVLNGEHDPYFDALRDALSALPDIAQGDVVEVPRADVEHIIYAHGVGLIPVVPVINRLRALLSDPAKGDV